MQRIKDFLRHRFPFCVVWVRGVRSWKQRWMPRRWLFSRMYAWDKRREAIPSISGRGVSLKEVTVIREKVPLLLKELGIRSLLDAPCGELFWMAGLSLDIDRYVGVDIVPELIILNRQKYRNGNWEFINRDIRKDKLPRADLILCRDGLVHLSFRDVFSCLRNFKRTGSTYLLTTTFNEPQKNEDILTGDWRPINLQLLPFHFPQPIKVIGEQERGYRGRYADKSLGLWRLSSILI